MLVTIFVSVLVVGYLVYMAKYVLDVYNFDLVDKNENY